jgi:hypothetical protein
LTLISNFEFSKLDKLRQYMAVQDFRRKKTIVELLECVRERSSMFKRVPD